MTPDDDDQIELEPTGQAFSIPSDARPRMEEPLPVRLVAIADLTAPAQAGLEPELTRFYAGLWEFQRDDSPEGLAFRADNFRLLFQTREGLIDHDSLRPIGIEVRSLADALEKLSDVEIEHTRQRGVQPGTESILLQDPSGNWVELTERREL